MASLLTEPLLLCCLEAEAVVLELVPGDLGVVFLLVSWRQDTRILPMILLATTVVGEMGTFGVWTLQRAGRRKIWSNLEQDVHGQRATKTILLP